MSSIDQSRARRVSGVLILTVTPNLALDLTYEVPRPTAGTVNRVLRVRQRAGG